MFSPVLSELLFLFFNLKNQTNLVSIHVYHTLFHELGLF
uniref:Uncharacterized protein n=1 Tax=Anguilla anguilla TaxID=7936 RepID=A0A0E9PU65_ANGAN